MQLQESHYHLAFLTFTMQTRENELRNNISY